MLHLILALTVLVSVSSARALTCAELFEATEIPSLGWSMPLRDGIKTTVLSNGDALIQNDSNIAPSSHYWDRSRQTMTALGGHYRLSQDGRHLVRETRDGYTVLNRATLRVEQLIPSTLNYLVDVSMQFLPAVMIDRAFGLSVQLQTLSYAGARDRFVVVGERAAEGGVVLKRIGLPEVVGSILLTGNRLLAVDIKNWELVVVDIASGRTTRHATSIREPFGLESIETRANGDLVIRGNSFVALLDSKFEQRQLIDLKDSFSDYAPPGHRVIGYDLQGAQLAILVQPISGGQYSILKTTLDGHHQGSESITFHLQDTRAIPDFLISNRGNLVIRSGFNLIFHPADGMRTYQVLSGREAQEGRLVRIGESEFVIHTAVGTLTRHRF